MEPKTVRDILEDERELDRRIRQQQRQLRKERKARKEGK